MTQLQTLFALLLTASLLVACGSERAPIASSVADAPSAKAGTPTPNPQAPETDANSCIDPAQIDPSRMCTMDYTPVCGCDGKTHSNACKAGAAGVTEWAKGACDATH
ncbi:hypothetical protein L1F30_02865 [Simiduia sp. 21SJ11W-1]|uniref:Kazal-type serine protease inhibitor family protein n=1 Tax=Simiduia sp. 21SJ11W-1 TaxID=2909669 RepID=UPI00209DF8B4|nr:Kazal-type serine protease inhibitor domain-containing protein [Simiduia sp. 21SJ11W-1]UTA48495.1 hypothetical protein L1F30_02865 [Simiduia sp. 21SJ11W-1]